MSRGDDVADSKTVRRPYDRGNSVSWSNTVPHCRLKIAPA